MRGNDEAMTMSSREEHANSTAPITRCHTRVRVLFVLSVAAAMLVMVLLHAPGVNGPWYWKWEWRRAASLPLYPLMLLSAAPIIAAQWMVRSTGARRAAAVMLVAIGTLLLRYASVFVQPRPPGLELIPTIIRSPEVTSYYTDAVALGSPRAWFGAYDQVLRLPGLHLHTVSKPPGAVLFFAAIVQRFGDTNLATHVAAAVMGVLAMLVVPATYLLAKRLASDAGASRDFAEVVAFAGASFLPLCPGFVLFFPMFDPVYALLSCGLIGFWAAAVAEESKWWFALAMGGVLALTCMITFNVLLIGLFCAAWPFVIRKRALAKIVPVVLRQGLIVLATAAGLLLALHWFTGYDPIATFHSAWANQHALLATHAGDRPYPATILFDLTDFALGSGWLSAALVACYLVRTEASQEPRSLTWLVLGQFLFVAALGLLQSETARVWNFMLPLLMIPVGLELSRWPRRMRAAVLVALAIVTCAICQNMKFLF
jgi:hypothetical protein